MIKIIFLKKVKKILKKSIDDGYKNKKLPLLTKWLNQIVSYEKRYY